MTRIDVLAPGQQLGPPCDERGEDHVAQRRLRGDDVTQLRGRHGEHLARLRDAGR